MRNKKKFLKAILGIILLCIVFVSVSVIMIKNSSNKKVESNKNEELENQISKENAQDEENDEEEEIFEVLISAAGDCTLGTDTKFDVSTNLITAVANANNDYSHLMKNMESVFANDDYTIVNLENPFTDADVKAYKGEGRVFHFKGPLEFTSILKEGNIEGVTISNNHIYDYGEEGYQDTKDVLNDAQIEFCGEGDYILKDIKGIKFGFLGYQAWNDTQEFREKIKNDIDMLKETMGAKIVIPYFHWGIEREAYPSSIQENIAKFAIDSGAEMVLGSHPHVIQSIENYKGKLIVYSLANFSFGGNSNPSDKRTFVTQIKYTFKGDDLINTEYKIIPAKISSVDYKNDYIPTLANGPEADNILKYINEISPTIEKLDDNFFSLN